MTMEHYFLVGVDALLLVIIVALYHRLRQVANPQEHVESLLHDANLQLLRAGKELQRLAQSAKKREKEQQHEKTCVEHFTHKEFPGQKNDFLTEGESEEIDVESIDRMLARGAKPETIARSLGVSVDLVRIRLSMQPLKGS